MRVRTTRPRTTRARTPRRARDGGRHAQVGCPPALELQRDLGLAGLVGAVRVDQARVRDYAAGPGLTLLCGRYEGIDERLRALGARIERHPG